MFKTTLSAIALATAIVTANGMTPAFAGQGQMSSRFLIPGTDQPLADQSAVFPVRTINFPDRHVASSSGR
jgi:hypothetical protein